MVLLLVIACLFLCTSSRAWFMTTANTEQSIEVEADGVVYISVPYAVDMIEEGETNRVLRPAKAMPFALVNGAPMDVTKTYAQTQGTDNVSYISVAATQGIYSGEFHYSQPESSASYVQFSLSHYLQYGDEDSQLSIDEITIDEISFYYNRQKVVTVTHYTSSDDVTYTYETERVNALEFDENCTLSANKTSGRFYVAGAQQIYYEVRMHLTYVDELIDSRLGQTDHFFTGVSLWKSPLVASIVPDDPEHVYSPY